MLLSRILVSFTALVFATVLVLVTVTASPMTQAQATGPGPLEQGANPNTPENPVPRRTQFVAPEAPVTRYSPLIVELRVTLDERGRVGEVRQLAPARETHSFYIRKSNGGEILGFAPLMNRPTVPPDYYQPYVTSSVDAVRQWQYDAPANGPIVFDVTFGFPLSSLSNEVRVLWEGLTVAGGALGVGPRKVKDLAPVYPPIAMSARIQGAVIIEAHVDADGRVSDARILRSIPLLDQAAKDAVMRWQFTPTVLNGTPVPIVVTTSLQFTLMF